MLEAPLAGGANGTDLTPHGAWLGEEVSVLRRLRALKYRLWAAWDGDWEVRTALRSPRSPLETEAGLEEA